MNVWKDIYKKPKKPFTFIPKYDKDLKTQDVKLCVGMPIIAHLTEKKLNILNSEKFVVKSIDTKNIIDADGDRLIKVALENFHKYFYLGFCITIYASQGETFENKYTIYDWNFKHFCNKGKYVALSRATSINNIQIGHNNCVDCGVYCKLYYRCLRCHKTKMGWCDYTGDNNDDEEENGNDYGDEDLYANQRTIEQEQEATTRTRTGQEQEQEPEPPFYALLLLQDLFKFYDDIYLALLIY